MMNFSVFPLLKRMLLCSCLFAALHVFSNTSLADEATSPSNRTAVIIIGNPGFQYLDHDFKSLAAQTEDFYKQSGFSNVIILSDSQADPNKKPTAANFSQTLNQLQNTTELQIDFISHGAAITQADLTEQHPELQDRFTSVPQTPGQIQIFEKAEGQSANGQKSLAFAVAVDGGSHPENDIGIADIRKALTDTQKHNPNLQATIYGTTCYGGLMSEGLSDLAKTQVFSGTGNIVSTLKPASALGHGMEYTDTISFEYQIFLQKNLQRGMSYLQAHDQALKDYIEVVKNDPDIQKNPTSELAWVTLPQNSLQGYVQRWCADNSSFGLKSQSPKASCQRPALLTPLKHTNKIEADFVKTSYGTRSCQQVQTTLEKIQQAKFEILQKSLNWVDSRIKSIQEPNQFKILLTKSKVNFAANSEAAETISHEIYGDPKSSLFNTQQASLQQNMDMRRSCIEHENSFHKKMDCSFQSLTGHLATASSFWSGQDPNSYLPAKTKLLNECLQSAPPIHDVNLADQQKSVLQFTECVKKSAIEPPVVKLQVLNEQSFGDACPAISAQLDLETEKNKCLESFANSADCSQWNRLAELENMGSQHMSAALQKANPIDPNGAR